MTVTIPIPELSEIPWQAWAAAGSALWYTISGAAVRWSPICNEHDGKYSRFWLWAFSPVVLPVAAVAEAGGLFGRYALTRKSHRVEHDRQYRNA